jgi:hypothetical protein
MLNFSRVVIDQINHFMENIKFIFNDTECKRKRPESGGVEKVLYVNLLEVGEIEDNNKMYIIKYPSQDLHVVVQMTYQDYQISRLEVGDIIAHRNNSEKIGYDIFNKLELEDTVHGNHFHKWMDNKHVFSDKKKHSNARLPIARTLDTKFEDINDVVIHFAKENNIKLANNFTVPDAVFNDLLL